MPLFTITLPDATIELIRKRSKEANVNHGELVDLLVRMSSAKCSDDALRRWAATLVRSRGPRANGMRLAERMTLQGFAQCKREQPHAYTFESREIARGAGLKIVDALSALSALRNRGLVDGVIQGDETDAWGRPLRSLWWIVADREAWLAKQNESKAT